MVTVCSADVVGYSRTLSEHRDPEQAKRSVRRRGRRAWSKWSPRSEVECRQAVLGDGIIALFGAPVAHEDDAERAVRAGMQMHADDQPPTPIRSTRTRAPPTPHRHEHR